MPPSLTTPLRLAHTPGSIAILDDDFSYLEMLGMVLPADWNVELYNHPSPFLQRMQDGVALWHEEAEAHGQIIESWRGGASLIPSVLRYWASSRRHALVRSVVVDYSIPSQNGLEVLKALGQWQGSRMILTGFEDLTIAVTAFNEGLIDQFIPKHGPAELLPRGLKQLRQRGNPVVNALWESTLKPWQKQKLRTSGIAEQIANISDSRWVEYVILPEPFGILGLTMNGRCEWLQFECRFTQQSLAETGLEAGLTRSAISAIEGGQLIAAIELHDQLRIKGAVKVEMATPFGESTDFRWALFHVETTSLGIQIRPYRDILRMAEHRTVVAAKTVGH